MKKWKRMMAGVLAAGLMMTVSMPVYAGIFGNKKSTTATEAATEKTEYALTYKETEIHLNKEAAPILKALGKYESCFEQQSCAYQGMDKIYTYPGIELGTYPVNGKEHISSIYFIDDTVSTQEGIKLGSTYDEMVKAYGKEYTEEFGVYRYVLGKTELSIYTTNKVVDAIEYQIKQ